MDPSKVGKAAIIATLRQRVEQLVKENRELRKQLEVVYGEIEKVQRRRQ